MLGSSLWHHSQEIKKIPAQNGKKRMKKALLSEASQEEILITSGHKKPSQMLKLKAIPVYRNSTGNKETRIEGKIAACMLNKNSNKMLIKMDKGKFPDNKA